jgi:anionic cell wall polymer biosynthesis LytR-Cps2A-Psr (LCP) family protein
MKTMFLTLMTIIGLSAAVSAYNPETVTVKNGQKKSVPNGEFSIKFLSVTEDSRCPVDANCVWAGNAKVHVRITDRHGRSKTMVMNTTMGPAGDQYNGWAIYLTELTPAPKSGVVIKQSAYKATFSIQRLTR